MSADPGGRGVRVDLSGLRGVGECERGYFRRVAALGFLR